MERKNCSMCTFEKREDSYRKYTERKNYNSISSLKCYYEKKDKISNQRKINFENRKVNCYRTK